MLSLSYSLYPVNKLVLSPLSGWPLELILQRIDYSPTTKKLIVSCASREHNYMSNIGREIIDLVRSDSNAFTGNDPDYQIIEHGDDGTISCYSRCTSN